MIRAYNQYRRTSLLSDNPDKLGELLSAVAPTVPNLFVSENTNRPSIHPIQNTISPKDVNQFLGQEFSCIVFDASKNFDVNAFTAIIGTLIGGGHLILILPKEFKPLIEGNKRQELNVFSTNQLLYRFVQRTLSSLPSVKKDITDLSNEIQIEQHEIVDKINRCALGHAKRPLVITANRGRGKSASLGIAAALLAIQHNKKIIVTAPRKANVKIFFQHVKQQISDYHSTKLSTQPTELSTQQAEPNLLEIENKIVFVSPDRLLKEKPDANLLIIDEAGAIPVQMLDQMVSRYNRVIFSTTVDGYEGNGRGFDIRFKSILAKTFPQWRSATLKHPIRWPKNDPLEIATNDAFLLNRSMTLPPLLVLENKNEISYRKISKSVLLNDESLLQQIYNLLVDAHYQTRPSDLDRMLSDESLLIFAACYKKRVIATALICQEGNLTSQQCQLIETGNLRLPGQLLPQSLMAYQGITGAGESKFWRVMRITVMSEFQKNKIASQLICHIEQCAVDANVDLLGASYSLNPEVIRFWYKLRFKCCRLALRKDSSTGNFPGEFIKLTDAAKPAGVKCYNASLYRFETSFYYSITASYSDIKPAILLQIIKNQCHQPVRKLLDNILKEITRYTEKARSFEMVEWQLNQLVGLYFSNNNSDQNLSEPKELLLVAKLLQNKSWSNMINEFDFSGKKQIQEAIREAIIKIIPDIFPHNSLNMN